MNFVALKMLMGDRAKYIGIIIGLIVVLLYLPIFELAGSIQ